MHPIEHLRYLARSGETRPEWLLPEVAEAFGGLEDDRLAMVSAARVLLDHLPTCGPLWWFCSRLMSAAHAEVAAAEALRELREDPTDLQVALALSGTDETIGGPFIVQASMAGPSGALVFCESAPADDIDDKQQGAQIWLTAGVGSVAPGPVFDDARARFARRARGDFPPVRFIDAARIAKVIRPSGTGEPGRLLVRSDFSVVSELLARG